MAPTLMNDTQTYDLETEPLSASCATPNCAFMFMFLMLVFYALALWDRWLHLKMAEQRKQSATIQNYGSFQDRTASAGAKDPSKGKKGSGLLSVPLTTR
ncbi:hypothetical protein C8J56DRAFT_1037586 [Mycena floridula]|nr:hypothetical protein C8J56DRAFT_1037586 [Mycena floridula]